MFFWALLFGSIQHLTYIFFLKKNQQFITLSIRADHGNYSVTTYMEPEPTGEKSEMK